MISWIKYVTLNILRGLLRIFEIFPIKKNRIVFYSFNGKQYSCNPRQISEYLDKNYPGKFEIIWAFKYPQNMKPLLPRNFRVVKYRSLAYYYFAKTAKVIVQNVQGYGEIRRRKNQDIIQTWHASNGYKRQGQYSGIKRHLELLYHKDYSYVLCGTESMLQRRVRGTMGFKGEVVKGTPRMDVIINLIESEDKFIYKKRVYEFLNVEDDKKILLYAPTWRNDRNDNDYGLDYMAVKEAMEKRFGGEWIIAVRFHPNVYVIPELNNPFIRNATNYPDMQELLCVADALISDYSSCIWDYSFTLRPCFLFCSDLEKYGKDRDFDIPIKKWHFPIATNLEELREIIQTFDEEMYKSDILLHHEEMGNFEDGKATERVCLLIKHLCYE